MKIKIVRHVVSLCWAAIVVLLLAGCNPTAGATEYEVIFPSGYSRDCYAYDEKSPIEGSSCCLKWEKADDYEKTYDYDIHILDENGSVLYSYPDVGSKAMRGSVQEDGKIWVCAEHWTAPHHNGYVEGWLKESDLLLIDLSDGEILFQDKAGENEFCITTYGTRCYFYLPGNCGGWLFTMPKVREMQANSSEKVKSVYCFLIAPEMKRKGIAKRLLEYVCQDAAESRFDYVEAYPWKETVDERTFFMGFVDMYQNLEFKICGETEDKFLMRRALKGNR